MKGFATLPILGGIWLLAVPAHGQIQGNEQQEMVSSHNIARKDVEPTAAVVPLPAMTWNATLASGAQSWANNCTWAHSGTPGVGENLFASSAFPVPPRPSPAEAVFDWVGEAQDYDYAANSCSGTCGHYTQVVWRSSTQVGCGIKLCATGSPFGPTFPTWYIWVCQYSPPGNFGGQRPYLCDYGSGNELCISTRIFADGLESNSLGGWGGQAP